MSDNQPLMWPARRRMLAALGGGLLLPAVVRAQSTTRREPLRPPRLRPGDTIGLVNPSGAVFERQPYELAADTLQALGFRVCEAPNLRARYGHMAGTPSQRAADLHALFADDSVAAILAVTGGSGANRVLPLLDMELIARHPKVLAGFSDVTALLNGVHARTGLVTFHAPVGVSEWNEFSVRSFRRVVVEAEAATLANQPERGEHLVARDGRVRTLHSGRAQGPLLGGNLAVLASLAGSRFMPDFAGAILFLEDTNEFIYRVDRMLSTLMLAGVLDRLAGVVLGAFTNCQPGEGFGALTLDEVFDDYFGRLGVPVYAGAQFGHIRRKLTLPVGLPVEMDADAGTIRLRQPAVR